MHDTGAPTIDEVKSDLKRALIERLQADGILDASARATELVQILEVALSEDLRIRRRLDGPHDAGRRLRDVLRQ